MPGNGRELFHRAHYNMLSKRIRELKQEFPTELSPAVLEERLAEWFEQDNPRFEEDAWHEHCDAMYGIEVEA